MDDGLAASTEAAERLRQALVSGGDVSAALRNLMFRNHSFWAALVTAALAMRYGRGSGRDLSAFIGGVAAASGADFPARQAELLVRAALDPATADLNFDPSGFDTTKTMDAVLVALFSEWHPTADEVAALFTRAETTVAQTAQLMPQAREVMELLASLDTDPDTPVDPELEARVLALAGVADFNDPVEMYRKLWRRAAQQVDWQRLPPGDAPQLARILDNQGDVTQAQTAYEHVIASGEGELRAGAVGSSLPGKPARQDR